jgi:hypothetical protein
MCLRAIAQQRDVLGVDEEDVGRRFIGWRGVRGCGS